MRQSVASIPAPRMSEREKERPDIYSDNKSCPAHRRKNPIVSIDRASTFALATLRTIGKDPDLCLYILYVAGSLCVSVGQWKWKQRKSNERINYAGWQWSDKVCTSEKLRLSIVGRRLKVKLVKNLLYYSFLFKSNGERKMCFLHIQPISSTAISSTA